MNKADAVIHPLSTINQRAKKLGDVSPSPFMKFWKSVNTILRSRGLPEMLYGEAHGFWREHQEQSWGG